ALADLGPAELVVEARIAAAIAAAGADGEDVLGLGAVAQAAAEIVGRNALDRPAVAVVARDVAFADRDDVVLAGFGIGEVGVQRAQVVAVVAVRAPVQVEVEAGALAVDRILAALHLDRGQAIAGDVLELVVVLDLDVVGLVVAVLPAEAEGDAEAVVGVDVAEVERGLGAGLAAQVLVAGLELGAHAAAAAVEGRGRLDPDRAAQRIAGHVGRGRLDDGEVFGRFGRDHVQRRGAAAVFGRAHGDTVDDHRVLRRVQAADHHVAALALVAGDADAGQARERLAHVLVGEPAHGVRGDSVLDRIGAALALDRARLRFELRAHDHGVEVGGIHAGGVGARALRDSDGNLRSQRERDGEVERMTGRHVGSGSVNTGCARYCRTVSAR